MAPMTQGTSVEIIDIRRTKVEETLLEDLIKGLHPENGKEKTFPTLLLYDQLGLKLFEDITYLDEYYLTNAEIEVFQRHAEDIANKIQPGTRIIELGSGNLRKVNILLQALERAQKNVEYYALDLSESELERTFLAVSTSSFKHVKCFGLHGTYDDGLAWLSQPENRRKPKCILSLGSSIGNFTREDAIEFLAQFAKIMDHTDSMLVGVDACQSSDRVFHAYNDREGVTHRFILNGFIHANKLLRKDAFDLEKWKVIGRYNEQESRHEVFCVPLEDVQFKSIYLKKGEMIRIEESYKYSAIQSEELWKKAGLAETASFGNSSDDYHIHMLTLPAVSWSLRPEEYAATPVPTLEEFETLWKAWNTVSQGMIPHDKLLSKPIKLRNACIFYLGHIPTFLDIHLTRATEGKSTEPTSYRSIFERGIDPDVDNPEKCHSHSEIPDEWPPVEEILEYQEKVRSRVRELFATKAAENNRRVGRALWLGFEHDLMHLETLLYMLLQSEKMLPPPGTERPDFKALAKEAAANAVPNEWINIPANKITLGFDGPYTSNNLQPGQYFGWDNEGPTRVKDVPAFVAKARVITNGEYAKYLEETHQDQIPASWTEKAITSPNGTSDGLATPPLVPYDFENGTRLNKYLQGKFVKTVYGPVPLEHVLDWPVIASYDELAGCAKWMNGRIPTMEEVKSIYNYVDEQCVDKAARVQQKAIPAVNGHLSNDGVEETPPSYPDLAKFPGAEQHPDLHRLYTNLEGCNVGLHNWHPTPVTQNGNKLSGQGQTGGAWEWTSSTLEEYEGFKAMDIYPGYTADFFDGKHNIVLGGSWATHPRLAGRKTFMNWYQRNYLYPWCTARLVRDA
ncbi:MAG: hypothetical protein M1834_007865 [Cirrosporium novae-zelandiae]|nr:MAG: hypothetical protein M1834_007865 [Cirrosporium novae-zelandiae]